MAINTDMLLIDLKRDEGMVLHSYFDSEGYASIGIGRLIDQRRGGGISENEALYLCKNDIFKVIADLDRELPWWRAMTEPRCRALANACFNLGIPGLLEFKLALAALQAQDYDQAYHEFLSSRWSAQVGQRAVRIAGLIRNG